MLHKVIHIIADTTLVLYLMRFGRVGSRGRDYGPRAL